MANSKSAKKRVRVNERNRLRNRTVRTALRTNVKKYRALIAAGDAEAAASMLPTIHSIIDRTAKKGVIKENAARRYKSRLTLAHRRLVEGAGAAAS